MKRQQGFTLIEAMIVVLIVLGIVVPNVRGVFVSDDVGVRALDAAGFTDIKVVDNAFFAVGFRGCDMQDAARITLTATNSQGRTVTQYVCAGWPFKGATIRNP